MKNDNFIEKIIGHTILGACYAFVGAIVALIGCQLIDLVSPTHLTTPPLYGQIVYGCAGIVFVLYILLAISGKFDK